MNHKATKKELAIANTFSSAEVASRKLCIDFHMHARKTLTVTVYYWEEAFLKIS